MPPGTQRSARALKNAANRLKTFKEVEAAKAPEYRLLNRTDWDDDVRISVSRETMGSWKSIMEWFEDFSSGILELPSGDSAKYFVRGGPRPSIAVVRQFMTSIAQTHRGWKSKTKVIRLSTMKAYLMSLWGAVRYYNKPFEREAKNQHVSWLVEKLLCDEKLETMPLEKPVAYPADSALLLSALYRPHVPSTFRNGTDILRATLLINLSIDLCGRIGELLIHQLYYDDQGVEILDDSVIGCVLTWGRVKFQVHRVDPAGPVRVSAVVEITGMKGMKKTPGFFKKIPLSTLPPEHAFDDSVRLLLYLAIVEGHFVNERITGVHCLQQLQPGPFGMELAIKESSKNIPVFVDGIGRPQRQRWFGDVLKLLSRELCLQQGLTSRAFRRGIAHHLHMETDGTTQRRLMGHGETSNIFFAYQSDVSQVDVQAVLRGLSAQNVLIFSSMLNLAVPNTPKVLSEADRQAVASHPLIQTAQELVASTLDEVLRLYDRTSDAKAANAPSYEAYLEASNTLRKHRNHLSQKQFQQEVEEYIEFYKAQEQDLTNGRCLKQDGIQSPRQHLFALPPVASKYLSSDATDGLHYSADADTQSAQEEGSPFYHDFEGQDLEEMIIDPQLVDEDGTDITNAIESLLALSVDSDEAMTNEDGQSITTAHESTQPIQGREVDSPTVRNHQVLGNATVKAMICPRPTIADGLHESVVSGHRSDMEIDGAFVRLFKLSHQLNKFPPHMMPIIDKCPYCFIVEEDVPHSRNQTFFQHIRACSKQAKIQSIPPSFREPDSLFLSSPCQLRVGLRTAANPLGNLCNKTFPNDVAAWRQHMIKLHLDRPTRTCRLPVSASACGFVSSEKTRYAEKMSHLLEDHGINVFTTEQLMQWCLYCEKWEMLVPWSASEDQHYMPHLSDALQNVSKYGYEGVSVACRWLVPHTCIFCLHNAKLTAKERVNASERYQDHDRHIWYHLNQIVDGVPCPASTLADADCPTCQSQDLFTADSLRDHLSLVHGIKILDSVKTKSTKPRKRKVKAESTRGQHAKEISDNESATEDMPSAASTGILAIRDPNSPVGRKSYRVSSGKQLLLANYAGVGSTSHGLWWKGY